MVGIKHIDDERSAGALADLLNGNGRRRPIVVVTIPADRATPWIDVEEVAREAGTLADIYLMPTGSFTWEFSNRMAEGTQVYGGAGRVYPVGHEWASDLRKSPLRFAFNADDGQRATQHLISDALRMAASAGLLQSLSTRALREVEGTVKIVIAGRALVDVGNLFPAAIAEELTVVDVPIEHIAMAGQQVEGLYDSETNRIDVTKRLRSSAEALAAYAVGDVVLTKVATVRNGKAELVVYPKTASPAVVAKVLRADVTTNPADDLRTLMTVGEVIPARVVATAPTWALELYDVDDDELIVDAPSLLVGGPPWLTDEPEDLPAEPEHLALPSLPKPSPAPERLPEDQPAAKAPSQTPARPSPTLFDRNRASASDTSNTPPADAPPAAESTRGLLLKIDGLNAEIARLKREEDELRTQTLAGVDEAKQLRYLLGSSQLTV